MNANLSSKKWAILLICGLCGSFEQWCRILTPFAQWQLEPRPDLYDTLVLNSIGNGAVFVGSFLIAHMIDSIGAQCTAIWCTIFTGLYQMLYGWIHNYYIFGLAQLLLLFNHMPTIADTLIAQMTGDNVDQKTRTRLIMQVTIPTTISFATGPFMAVQVLYIFSPSLEMIQSLCGILHLITLLPLIIVLLPRGKTNQYRMSNENSFFTVLKSDNVIWTIVFIMLISGPYSAYDQVIRLHLTGYMLTKPYEMALLALLLGSAALIANMIVLPLLQKRFYSNRIVQISLGLMIISYLYLVHYSDYVHIMVGMTIQIIGVWLSLGQLSAQILFSVPRSSMAKAAAFNRMAQLAASIMTPLITGYYVDHDEAALLCYTNIGICIFAILLIEFYGGFMGKYSLSNLPLLTTHIE